MASHSHNAATRTRDDFPRELAWAEWVRDYYRDIETYDWVDVADNVRGLEAFFHRNRRQTVRTPLKRYRTQSPVLARFDMERIWHSALRFNVLFVARRPA
jgi:hypothetical protein